MSDPKSIEELTRHIEQAVDAYIEAVIEAGRRAAQEALERTLSASGNSKRASDSRGRRKPATAKSEARKNGPRRTPEELAELQRRLYEAVQEEPGTSMAVLASSVGASVRELHHPMTVLKREERVRTVGRKQHMRYFPALASDAEASAA